MINTLLFMVVAILLGRSIEQSFSANETIVAVQLLVITAIVFVLYIRQETKSL